MTALRILIFREGLANMEPLEPDELQPEPAHLDHDPVEPPPPLPPEAELPDEP
jgi:hypothetical protein